jgi:hypothetical protein
VGALVIDDAHQVCLDIARCAVVPGRGDWGLSIPVHDPGCSRTSGTGYGPAIPHVDICAGDYTYVVPLELSFAFIDREGERFFRVETEMRLAGEIHQALVPTIEHRI